MAEALTNFLNGIYPLPRNHYYSFTNVVTKAREAGIKIQPIDCTVSYILRDMRDSAGTLRQRMMNYYATEVIQWIQTSKRQPGKWVALVGDTHTNTFKDIPGLAELTGSIGLRIEDRTGTHPLGIEVDPGRTASLGLNKGEGTVKANLVLRVDPAALQHSMESQPGPSHSRVVKSAQALLTRPGNSCSPRPPTLTIDPDAGTCAVSGSTARKAGTPSTWSAGLLMRSHSTALRHW